MNPRVGAVLQNLGPIVDNGRITPDATYNATSIWGATLGANAVGARSGIGVTADPHAIVPAKLCPQMQPPADRDLGPTRDSRDFFTVSLPAPA
jgi:hypothetical protein